MPAGNPEGYNVPGDPSSGVKPGAGGEGELMEGINAIGESLMALSDGLSKSGAPPELAGLLDKAVSAYQAFTDALTGGGKPAGTQDQAAAGNPNAVPV